MRLGIFGGTFDPPHLGHVALAQAAYDQLQLDKVLWVVAGQSPLKLDRTITPAPIRVALVQAAIADNPAFELSRVDLDRPAPHYTIDTLRLLRQQYRPSQLFFIMGQDSLRDLPKWRHPHQIIERVGLAVAKRPGARVNLSTLDAIIPNWRQRIIWLKVPPLNIASSEIQERLTQRRSVRTMLPPAVYEIVKSKGLYQR